MTYFIKFILDVIIFNIITDELKRQSRKLYHRNEECMMQLLIFKVNV